MERQLPKNVRQIGNVCDEPKIYVEDYVDTFLGQLQEKAMEKPVAAALTGEITKCEDKVVVYISGAIRAEDVEVEGTNLKISEEIWEKIEKEQKEYFKDQKLIGWCLLETGHPMSMNRGAQELHRKMRHQAGFNNYAGDPVSSTRYIMMQNHLTTPPDHKTLLKILLKRHLGYTPGEGKCYSNLGYMILSMIIEKKSRMKYENFMQKYVLQPAGCYDMHIAGTYLKDRRPNETKYYMHGGSIPVYEYNNSGRLVEKCYGDTDLPRLSGAGAWCGSAAELSRLIASIDGMPHVKDILSKKSIQFMTTEQPDHQYSIGWNYTPKSNRPWIRTGSLAGTSAIVLKYPDGQCWILITNTSTWKGHGFSNDTVAFFEKLRKQFMADMPKKDLFI